MDAFIVLKMLFGGARMTRKFETFSAVLLSTTFSSCTAGSWWLCTSGTFLYKVNDDVSCDVSSSAEVTEDDVVPGSVAVLLVEASECCMLPLCMD
jgi:hypothetical protein